VSRLTFSLQCFSFWFSFQLSLIAPWIVDLVLHFCAHSSSGCFSSKADSLDSCSLQSDCLNFNVTLLTGVENCNGDCEYRICFELDLTIDGCEKDDEVSHTCIKVDEEVCTTPGNFSPDTEHNDFLGGHSQCQIVKGGESAEFLLKDGNTCENAFTRSTTPDISCVPRPATIDSCTGNEEGKECIWTVQAPDCGTSSPTESPTDSPTVSPTSAPTESPTVSPTSSPTESPTVSPTVSPTSSPTESPTGDPTVSPTSAPTPTESDTDSPTVSPTSSPTESPTESPTGSPTSSPTESPTDSPTVSPTSSPTQSFTGDPTPCDCIEKVLDFETLRLGQYIDHELEEDYYVTIFAEGPGAQTFGGKARVFDTSQPWADPDLGSPNSECEGGGPGIGDGGRPESDYSNCEALNYVLIIQEGGTNAPDDNENGGSITFTFLSPVKIEHIGLLDSDDEASPEIVVS
jgi:hypothetical protein